MTTMRDALIKAGASAAVAPAKLVLRTPRMTVEVQGNEEDWAPLCTQQAPLLLTSHERMLPPPPPAQTRFTMQAHDDLPLMLVTDKVTGRWVEVPLHELDALRDFLDKMFG